MQMLSQMVAPFLADADRAIADNRRLTKLVERLQRELGESAAIEQRMGEYIRSLEADIHAALKENIMLKSRMAMFGEAANKIVAEVTRENPDAFRPKRSAPFMPREDQKTRPVRALDPQIQAETSQSLEFLKKVSQ
jgi:hypothetical protein